MKAASTRLEHLSAAALLSLAAALPAASWAGVVIDQPVTDGGSYSIQYALPSQSFVAVSDSLASINVNVTNQFFGNISADDLADETLYMVLYKGTKINDAAFQLSQVSANAAQFLGNESFASGMLPFSFGRLALTVGETYTFQLFDFGLRYGVRYSNSNPYSGGMAYVNGSNPNYDLSFQVSAVPEPSTAALFAVSLGGLGWWLRRKAARCGSERAA